MQVVIFPGDREAEDSPFLQVITAAETLADPDYQTWCRDVPEQQVNRWIKAAREFAVIQHEMSVVFGDHSEEACGTLASFLHPAGLHARICLEGA